MTTVTEPPATRTPATDELTPSAAGWVVPSFGFRGVPVPNRALLLRLHHVDVGDLAYWPPGRAFCIFFGPTPVSRGTACRPASPVNVVGKIVGEMLAMPDHLLKDIGLTRA